MSNKQTEELWVAERIAEPRTRQEGLRIQKDNLALCGLALLLFAGLVVAELLWADGGDPDNEVRLTLF